MRMVIGAAALASGVLISLGTAMVASAHPDSAAWLLWVGGGSQVALLATGLFLLWRARAAWPGRWLVVAGAFAGGLIGLILAVTTTRSGIEAHGDLMVDGTREKKYELRIRLFGDVVYRKLGPAVQRTGRDGVYTGPDEGLESVMLAAGWSIAAAYVMLVSLLGAALVAGIRRRTISCS